jgi:hypothetical protein
MELHGPNIVIGVYSTSSPAIWTIWNTISGHSYLHWHIRKFLLIVSWPLIPLIPTTTQIIPQSTTSKVQAASTQTVGMQITGMPLVGKVLAILLVFGGFISTLKKQ